MRTALLTALALVAFAANSILCRVALSEGGADAASFTLVRIGSGAVALWLIRRARGDAPSPSRGWIEPLMLFVYAAAFSFAYASLTAGTGALLLFGSVQVTMVAAALRAGERLAAAEAAGLAIALAGLVLLVFPGLSAPPPAGSALMIGAGVAWGVYSLRGRGSKSPLADTARSFAWATPMTLAVAAASAGRLHADARGLALAACSGAIASAIGYVVWFSALPNLTAVRAATVQLAVPAIAALGGIALLDERLTPRLAGAAALILGGIAIAIAGRRRRTPR